MRVNGQPGRVVRGPAEPPLGEAERLAAERALALLKSGDIDAQELAGLVRDARDAADARATGPVGRQQREVRVWSVLTVDVVEGRIGFGEVAGLQLRASFDRREFGFNWQMQLPGGGDAVGWDVEVDIDLLLTRDDAAAEG